MKRPLNEYDTFIRWNEAVPILRKVQSRNEETLDKKVYSRNPFGFLASFSDFDQINNPDKIKIYAIKQQTGYIRRERAQSNKDLIDRYKVLLAKAAEGSGDFPNKIIGQPIIAYPPSCCTETYLVVNTFSDEQKANNFEDYIKTCFFRFLVMLRKPTQNMSKACFSFVPDLPMNEPWTDEKLYAHYDLTPAEIKFIESMIKEMK
jgi:site-specific DNA-methyltransferase (adenine-specific)